jgi:hypothetical protein
MDYFGGHLDLEKSVSAPGPASGPTRSMVDFFNVDTNPLPGISYGGGNDRADGIAWQKSPHYIQNLCNLQGVKFKKTVKRFL